MMGLALEFKKNLPPTFIKKHDISKQMSAQTKFYTNQVEGKQDGIYTQSRERQLQSFQIMERNLPHELLP